MVGVQVVILPQQNLNSATVIYCTVRYKVKSPMTLKNRYFQAVTELFLVKIFNFGRVYSCT